MTKKYEIIFDELILKQLKRIGKNQETKEIISKMLDKIEDQGSLAGKLLDSKLHIYEIKNKHPPLRLYFKHNKNSSEIYVFEYEMKTNEKKQKNTINKLKRKIFRNLGLLY